ncbi:MAG: ABC transporter permease [Opitutaceae bacterium]|nr:ABC transporter permease [Opitutaceae bacterium]
MSDAATARSWRATAARVLFSDYFVLWLCVVYVAVVAPFTPGFLTLENAGNLLATLLPLFVVALGQTLVLITGGIDLSVTSIIGLCSITGALAMNDDTGWLARSPMAMPVGAGVMLAAGALVGGFNGTAITRFRMPPFIVTLASMMGVSGAAVWLTQSKTINRLPDAFNALGGKTTIALVIALVVGISVHVMLSRSMFGRWLYAVGHNARTARVSGVPVNGVILGAYICSGVLAAVAAILYTGQAETGSPVLGQRILLDVIGATVIGGTSLFGGRGKVLWTLFGVLFLKLVDNSLNLLSLSLFTLTIVKGVVILLAALLDSLRTRLGPADR